MDRYPLGQPVRFSTTVKDTLGAYATPGGITLTLILPDKITTRAYASPTADSVGHYHQDAPTTDLTQLGDYEGKWVTTGLNSGIKGFAFTLFDPLTALPWRPTTVQVAKYVPSRTVLADQTSDLPANDFTDLTTPTGAQADGFIDDSMSWVSLRTAALDPSLYVDASAVAAIRAAGLIELSMPVRDADVSTAQALLAQADAMIERLVLANESANPLVVPAGLLSAWIMPDPVPWGDVVEIWS